MHDDHFVALARKRIEDSLQVKQDLLGGDVPYRLDKAAHAIIDCLRREGKVILFGNGGSASDAQHLAAEFLGRYYIDRHALPAVCLSDNNAAVTAIGNDYSYEETFARQLRGLGRSGDVAIAFSTSGRSPNVVRALEDARSMGLVTVVFTGANDGPMGELADHWFRVPSRDTPRIQEAYMLLGHILCEIVEGSIFTSDAADSLVAYVGH